MSPGTEEPPPELVVVRGGLEALAAAVLLRGDILRAEGDTTRRHVVVAPPGQWTCAASVALADLARVLGVRSAVMATGDTAQDHRLAAEATAILVEILDTLEEVSWGPAPTPWTPTPSWVAALRWQRTGVMS